MMQFAIPSHYAPIEHPVQSASVVQNDDGILTLDKLVACYYNPNTKHHFWNAKKLENINNTSTTADFSCLM